MNRSIKFLINIIFIFCISKISGANIKTGYLDTLENGTLNTMFFKVDNVFFQVDPSIKKTGWDLIDAPQKRGYSEYIFPSADILMSNGSSVNFVNLEFPGLTVNQYIMALERLLAKSGQSLGPKNDFISQVQEGASYQKKIGIRGVAEKTDSQVKMDLTQFLNLDPMYGKAFALLMQPINNKKSIVFEAQTEGECQIAFMQDLVSPEYSLKIILGPNESKILTKEEEDFLEIIDADGKAFIPTYESVTFKNLANNKYLNTDLIYSDDPKDPKAIFYTTLNASKNWKEFLENDSLIFLKNDNSYLSSGLGGKMMKVGSYGNQELFRLISQIESKDKRLKDGDIVKIQVAKKRENVIDTTDSFLVPENNGWTNRWESQNGSNQWQINLANDIYRKKIAYPKISKQDNPQAMSKSGEYGIYWVTVDNDHLYFGSGGIVGKNLIFYRRIPDKFVGKLNYIGWASNKDSLNIRNILLSDTLQIQNSDLSYKKMDSLSVGPSFNFLPEKFYSKFYGSIEFNALIKDSLTIGFSNLQKVEDIKYKINIKKNQVDFSANDEIISSSGKISEDIISETNSLSYKLSINGGLILLQVNNKLVFAYQIKEKDSYTNISFLSPQASIIDLNITPASRLLLSENPNESIEAVKVERIFKILKPFIYWLWREQNVIKFKDYLYDPRSDYEIAAMPEERVFNFRFDVGVDGLFFIYKTQDTKPSAGEIAQRVGANALCSIGQGIAGVAGAGASSATMGLGIAGAAVSAAGAAWGASIDYQYPTVTGIYLEAPKIGTGLAQNDPTVIRAKAAIDGYVKTLDKISDPFIMSTKRMYEKDTIDIKTPEGFERAVENLQRIFFNLIASGIIDVTLRNRILNYINDFYKVLKNISPNDAPSLYNVLINLLISAYNNRFFLDPQNSKMASKRDYLYAQVNELTSKLFKVLMDGKVESILLKPFSGEALWTNLEIKNPNKWAISFKASGIDNIMMYVGPQKFKVRDVNKYSDLYMFIIGASNNSLSGIAFNAIGQMESFVTAKQYPGLMASSSSFRNYLAEFDGKTLSLGLLTDKGVQRIVQVPVNYPLANAKYVGFSSWSNDIKIKELKISETAEDLLKIKISPITKEEDLQISPEEISEKPEEETFSREDIVNLIELEKTAKKSGDTETLKQMDVLKKELGIGSFDELLDILGTEENKDVLLDQEGQEGAEGESQIPEITDEDLASLAELEAEAESSGDEEMINKVKELKQAYGLS